MWRYMGQPPAPTCGATRGMGGAPPGDRSGAVETRSFQRSAIGRVRTRPSQVGRAPIPGAPTPAAFRSDVLPPKARCWAPNNTSVGLPTPNSRPTTAPAAVLARSTAAPPSALGAAAAPLAALAD